jgi:hypothetical protein
MGTLPSDAVVRVSDLQAWVAGRGISLSWAGAEGPAPEYVPKLHTQEEAIIEWLEKNGHEPARLPPLQPGKRGIKAQARTELCTSCAQVFSSPDVFDKAWERLMKERRVAYS